MLKSSTLIEDQLRSSQPLVIIGMHRSGTSLVVRLLADLGFHMGDYLSRDAEAVFFQKLNRRIFNSVGAKWGSVDPLIEVMDSEDFVESQSRNMHKALFEDRRLLSREMKISEYFGSGPWEDVKDGNQAHWGWKDPRTTMTFPIWLRIFPQAKFLHIMRNGIDVAISTHRRTMKQHRNLIKRTFPLDYDPITLDFEYCFQLWESYLSFVFNHRDIIPDGNYLEVHYEDLLTDPEEQLQLICDFASFPVRDQDLKTSIPQIDRSRLQNSDFAANYRQQIPPLVSTSLMQQLGYSYNLEN
jgi:hypothetical protein